MVTLPQFYFSGALKQGDTLWLDESTVRHAMLVLRMKAGEQIQLTNGIGYTAINTITTAEKKKCGVKVETVNYSKPNSAALHIGVAFTKNNARNEWLLEKATELGAAGIIPIITTRSEREKMRYDRLQQILISAMLQSQQSYLPALPEAMHLKDVIVKYPQSQKLIAHCMDGEDRQELSKTLKPGVDSIMLIGPEGDFTAEEVNLCIGAGYMQVSLGTRRLRTETAAISVCAYFNMINNG
jgi:16S rRNA (uracil1498-N3)-methyltransferase